MSSQLDNFMHLVGKVARIRKSCSRLWKKIYYLTFERVNEIMGMPTMYTHKTPDEMPSEFNHETC